MVIENSSKGYQAKKEGDTTTNNNIAEKLSSSSSMAPSSSSAAAAASSSRQWTAFRNPRIVRVSRALGGKDRHSKVCTIRGLRDRRIRLSVPTAIQLYDLQDRLGLSQPSKVIDWLIEATKLDIDKLPPLQIPHGLFPHQLHHQQTLLPYHHQSSSPSSTHHHQFSLGGFHDSAANNNLSTFLKDVGGNNQNLLAKSTRYWDLDSEHSRLKGKEAESSVMSITTKGKWVRTGGGEQENQDGIDVDGYNNNNSRQDYSSSSAAAHKLFPGLLNNNAAMTYNNPSYNNSEPSNNLSLSQFGSLGLFPSNSHHHVVGSGSGVQFSSSNLAVPSSLFTPYVPFMANSSSVESDPRQFNHVQILSSSNNNNNSQAVMQPHPLLIPSLHSVFNNSSPLRRLPMPFSSKLLDSSDHNNDRSSEPNKRSSTTSS
ncbi:hypothetical protein RIF29_07900 [Crotalaria pallida]|uniref:TCP domain-containing protein n=1 Tax=Crotalaria pallida TaxID=3830 RepID=A0AAN9PBL3_CROPI